MRRIAILLAALLGVGLVGYALGLGIYAVASAPARTSTQPRSPEEADRALSGLALADAYPFAHRFLVTPHGRMHFADEGPRFAREVTLCLHGNASWSLECADLLRDRSDGERVVAPDLVGFGLSEKPTSLPIYAVDAHAADLSALVELLDLRAVRVVASPSSAPIAAALARLEPERVKEIAALEGAPRRSAAALRLARAPLLGELLVQGLGALSPGGPRGPLGRVQANWDERASSLALARAR